MSDLLKNSSSSPSFLARERTNDKAARAEAAAALLRKAVAVRDEAALQDAKVAAEQAAELTRYQEKTRELEKRIKDGDCLDGDAADWLRDNWTVPDFKRAPAVPRKVSVLRGAFVSVIILCS